MSIPAVLYDHVPVEDLHHDGDTQNETGEESFYVSSMVHRTSAPRKQDDDGNCNNGDKNTEQFVEHGKGSNKNNDGVSTNKNGENEYAKDTEFIGIDIDIDIDVENDESDDRPMETIIEDIDSYYVLIPIPPPAISGDHNHNSTLSIGTSQRATRKISNRIRSYGKAIFRAATRSPQSNRDRPTNFWKANNAVVKCLSGCASGTRAILKPLQFYVTDSISSSYSIYSSYDWVSETVIDGSGNRLILPGSCVALDSDDLSRNRTTNDGRRENSGEKHDARVTIVPGGLDAVGLDGRSQSSGGIPVVPLSSSSPLWWTSNTIMVSAHDLLAVKHDQRMQMGDRDGPKPLSLLDAIEEEEKEKSDYNRYYYRDDEYNMDRSTIIVATTQTVAQQWTRAFCTLAQRKANVWYIISRNYLRRSIRNTRRLCIIYSQQFLIQYYKGNDRRRCRSLSMSSSNNDFANSEANTYNINQYENRGGEHDTSCSTVSSVPPQKLSNRSYDYNESSDKKPNECEVTTRGSDYRCIIEMATPMAASQNSCSAL